MTPERCPGIPQAETQQRKPEGKLKRVAVATWAGISIGAAAALSFDKGLIGDIGAYIFMANILSPGACLIGKKIKDMGKPKVRT